MTNQNVPTNTISTSTIKLKQAGREDMEKLWKMQVEGFSCLLEKYHDDDMSPATETLERLLQKFDLNGTKYYFIIADGQEVGGIRIIDKKDGSRKRISPIWIMPEFRNKGYAQKAMEEVERMYGADNWCLDTILQEKGNLHLYEKMGYHQTGEIQHIKNGMDIVFYEKN